MTTFKFNDATTNELVGKPFELNNLVANRKRRIKRFELALNRINNKKNNKNVSFAGKFECVDWQGRGL
jgi:hypothetical protein